VWTTITPVGRSRRVERNCDRAGGWSRKYAAMGTWYPVDQKGDNTSSTLMTGPATAARNWSIQ